MLQKWSIYNKHNPDLSTEHHCIQSAWTTITRMAFQEVHNTLNQSWLHFYGFQATKCGPDVSKASVVDWRTESSPTHTYSCSEYMYTHRQTDTNTHEHTHENPMNNASMCFCASIQHIIDHWLGNIYVIFTTWRKPQRRVEGRLSQIAYFSCRNILKICIQMMFCALWNSDKQIPFGSSRDRAFLF